MSERIERQDAGAQQLHELFLRAKAGERDAQEEVFERVRPPLEKWITLRLGTLLRSRIDVEDVVQETLQQVFLALPRFEPQSPRATMAWVFKIAENRIRDMSERLKAGKRNPERERELHSRLKASWTSASMAAVRREEHERVLASLLSLPDKHREIIRLVKVEELSYDEAGERLGISSKNAGVRLVRALKAWREQRQRDDSDSAAFGAG